MSLQGNDEDMQEDWLTNAWKRQSLIPTPWQQTDLFPGLQRVTPSVTDSTNALLWRLLEQGYKPPLVAIAEQQTAGRGQWGRIWQSGKGGLYLSVLLACDFPLTYTSHVMILSAWGVAYALRQHQIPVKLKWPNDLLLGTQKLGGIKLETRHQQKRLQQVVIGVGINWCNSVPTIGIELASYCQQHKINAFQGLGYLAEVITAGLTLAWQRYHHGGIVPIHQAYLDYLAYQGQSVTLPEGTGIIKSVTTKGELVVRLDATSQLKVLLPGSIQLGYGGCC